MAFNTQIRLFVTAYRKNNNVRCDLFWRSSLIRVNSFIKDLNLFFFKEVGFCPPCQIKQWAFVQWDIVQWDFVLVGFCPSGLLSVPPYEFVIPTSSPIHILDLKVMILVLRTRLLHITSRIHQNGIFLAQMCTHLRFCVYVQWRIQGGCFGCFSTPSWVHGKKILTLILHVLILVIQARAFAGQLCVG